MIDKYIAYTNLLIAYLNEADSEKVEELRYQLLLLDAGFKPTSPQEDKNNEKCYIW